MYLRMVLVPIVCVTILSTCPVVAQEIDQVITSADAAFAARLYADAIPLFQQVVSSIAAPAARARAQFQIGWSHYFLDDRRQAQREWVRLADLFPNQPAYACEALLRAGNSATGGRDLTAAASYYKRAADTYTNMPEARQFAVQARCWLGNVHIRMAEDIKRLASEEARAMPTVVTGEVIWQQAAPDFRAAEEAYTRVIQDFPEAGRLVTEAEMLLISLKLESALYNQGKTYKDVLEAADQFLEKWPDDTVRRPTVLMMRAEACFYLKQYDDALSDLDTIETQYKDTSQESLGTARFYTARCYEAKREFGRAVAEYQNFLDDEASAFNQRLLQSQARFFIGRCLEWSGMPTEALAAYAAVMRNYPDCPVSDSAKVYLDDLAHRTTESGPPSASASNASEEVSWR